MMTPLAKILLFLVTLTSCTVFERAQSSLSGNAPSRPSPSPGAPKSDDDIVGFLSEDLPFVIRTTLNLPRSSDIQVRHLRLITELKLTERRQYSQHQAFFSQDFELFPNLKKLVVVYRTSRWLHTVLAAGGKKISHLHLSYEPQDTLIRSAVMKKPVPLEEIGCSLASLKLVALELAELQSTELMTALRLLRSLNLTALKISRLVGDFSDRHLTALSSLKTLRHLAIGLDRSQFLQEKTTELPMSLKSIRLSIANGPQEQLPNPQPPAPLAFDRFRFAKNALYVTIQGELPETLMPSPANRFQTHWAGLMLDTVDSSNAAPPRVEYHIDEQIFPHLRVFVSNSAQIQLNELSRDLVDKRLALKRFDDAIAFLSEDRRACSSNTPKLASTDPSKFGMNKILSCLMKF